MTRTFRREREDDDSTQFSSARADFSSPIEATPSMPFQGRGDVQPQSVITMPTPRWSDASVESVNSTTVKLRRSEGRVSEEGALTSDPRKHLGQPGAG